MTVEALLESVQEEASQRNLEIIDAILNRIEENLNAAQVESSTSLPYQCPHQRCKSDYVKMKILACKVKRIEEQRCGEYYPQTCSFEKLQTYLDGLRLKAMRLRSMYIGFVKCNTCQLCRQEESEKRKLSAEKMEGWKYRLFARIRKEGALIFPNGQLTEIRGGTLTPTLIGRLRQYAKASGTAFIFK